MTVQEVIAFLLGAVAAVALRALLAGSGGSDGAALARLERKLDQLLGQSGLPPSAFSAPMPTIQSFGPGGASSEVIQLVRQGKKIQAIKVYREQTGVGLKEAKDAVEELARRSP